VGIILTISVLLEQYWIARLFPPLGQLGGLRPMIVFLDIPLPLPNIDWIPVGFLFIFFYGLVISSEVNNRGQAPGALRRKKLAAALTGWWLLLLCILTGGGLYYLVQDFLPKAVRNGIDSFGIRADITLPYPSGELVHLHGSMLLLLCTVLGIRLLGKRTALPPLAQPMMAAVTAPATSRKPKQAAAKTTALPVAKSNLPPAKKELAAIPASPRKTASTTAYRRMPATVHEQYLAPDPPPDCRLTTPPPVAVILPKPAPRIGSVHPCIVAGMIEPAKTENPRTKADSRRSSMEPADLTILYER
jgi:hypothetical protein